MSEPASRRRMLIAAAASPFAWWAVAKPLKGSDTSTPPSSPAPITALAITTGGESLLAGSQAGVSIRDSDTIRETDRFEPEIENIHHLQFAQDGKTLVITGGTPAEFGVVEFYDWPSRTRRQRIETHSDVVYGCDLSQDGTRWVSASGDEVCEVYSFGNAQPQTRYTKHSRAVLAACFLKDSQTVVSASRDQTLRVWNGLTGESIRTLHNHSRDVHCLALKPSLRGLPMIASASADRTIRFWQPTIGRMVRFIRLPSEPLAIAWSPDAETMFAGCRDGNVRVIDPLRVEVSETHKIDDGWIHSLVVHQKTSQVIVGSSTGKVTLLDR